MTSKRLNLSVQYACNQGGLPSRPQIRAWVRAALDVDEKRGGQITIRFVEPDEGQSLNNDYREKDYATNVVAGDLVICATVVEREAAEQEKTLEAHYAHLIVHGILHLQGYDHEIGENEALLMEGKERTILAQLGFADPYRNDTD